MLPSISESAPNMLPLESDSLSTPVPLITASVKQVGFTDLVSGYSFLDTLAEIASQSAPLKSKFIKKEDTQRNRPRASSEPWLSSFITRQMEDSLQEANTSSTSDEPENTEQDGSNSSATLPQMLEKYSAIYNKNGRIGIYTREERNDMISRFHEKRKRRVWKKKIRYHCRKNLADSRVRVKGRFVKCADGLLPSAQKTNSAAGDLISSAGMKKSTESDVNGSAAMSSLNVDDASKKSKATEKTDKNEDAMDETSDQEEEEDGGDDELQDMLQSNGDINFTRKRMRRHSIAY